MIHKHETQPPGDDPIDQALDKLVEDGGIAFCIQQATNPKFKCRARSRLKSLQAYDALSMYATAEAAVRIVALQMAARLAHAANEPVENIVEVYDAWCGRTSRAPTTPSGAAGGSRRWGVISSSTQGSRWGFDPSGAGLVRLLAAAAGRSRRSSLASGSGPPLRCRARSQSVCSPASGPRRPT